MPLLELLFDTPTSLHGQCHIFPHLFLVEYAVRMQKFDNHSPCDGLGPRIAPFNVTAEAKKTLCGVSLIIFGKMAESFGQVVGNKTIAWSGCLFEFLGTFPTGQIEVEAVDQRQIELFGSG